MENLKKACTWLFGPVQNYWDSYKTADGGFSKRKLLAESVSWAFLYGNYKVFTSQADIFRSLVITVLIIDAAFIALMLGLVTAAELIKFKNGGSDPKNDGTIEIQKPEPNIPPNV